MGSKVMTWDAAADRKLFLGILKTQNVTVDNEAMAKYMSTEGQTCTASAISSRIGKLKAMAKKTGDGSTSDNGGSPKPTATPRKRAGGVANGETPPKKGKNAKDKSGKTNYPHAGNIDGDDEEAGIDTKVKKEEVDEDEDEDSWI